MKARLTSAAESELYDAAVYYENAQVGIGNEFLDAILNSIKKLENHPTLGSIVRAEYRSYVVRKFPYKIIYRISGDEILIHAVAHQNRRPDYWIDRIVDRT